MADRARARFGAVRVNQGLGARGPGIRETVEKFQK
jgi:hypothetical protein